MNLEAFVWVLLAMLGPTVLPVALARVAPRRENWALIHEVVPWVSGLLLPYLALITGAVLGRHAGLYGPTTAEWVLGVLVAGALLGAAAFALRRGWLPLETPEPLPAALDEPRWALYRAAGRLWTGSSLYGVLLGAALAVAEWALARQPWKEPVRRDRGAMGDLARAGTSALIFGLTQNFWLTLLFQIGLVSLVRWSRRT